MTLPTISFVVPWYGPHITGGAETVCRRMAEELQRRGYPVEVLTTCARQFHSDWAKNYHRAGVTTINRVRVRRFPLGARDANRFHALNLRLMRGYPITPADEIFFMQNMVNSHDLYEYIRASQADHIFLYIPYMFSTTYEGARINPANSFIIPCLHDEAYAHMRLFPPLMQQVRGLIMLSAPEREVAERLYHLPRERLHLLGSGVDTGLPADAAAFRHKYHTGEPYLVYVGRRDDTKNTPLLIEYFSRYKAGHPGDLKLVLIGMGPVAESSLRRGDILDAGKVDEQTKRDALAGAVLLCNPSVNESFSLAIMESWDVGRPVLVHADCAVTVSHCLASHGGLNFANYEEFAACLQWFLEHPHEADVMGRQGQTYVRGNFAWDTIVERLARLVYGLDHQQAVAQMASARVGAG